MNSYLALIFIEKENVNFYEGLRHKHFKAIPENEKVPVKTSGDIDIRLKESIDAVEGKKGILLSGGMDSAILASYMKGCDAYTFRFLW